MSQDDEHLFVRQVVEPASPPPSPPLWGLLLFWDILRIVIQFLLPLLLLKPLLLLLFKPQRLLLSQLARIEIRTIRIDALVQGLLPFCERREAVFHICGHCRGQTDNNHHEGTENKPAIE